MTEMQGCIFVVLILGTLLGWFIHQVNEKRSRPDRIINLFITLISAWAIALLIDLILAPSTWLKNIAGR